MDILIHLTIIIVIGLFFFLDKYSTSYNAMFIVIILSLAGFFLLLNDNIELVDYTTNVQINGSHLVNPSTDITDTGFGIVTMQAFLVLAYWFLLIIAAVNVTYGKDKKGGYKDD